MKVHLDTEDDLFLIPTIVISKVNSRHIKATLIHMLTIAISSYTHINHIILLEK